MRLSLIKDSIYPTYKHNLKVIFNECDRCKDTPTVNNLWARELSPGHAFNAFNNTSLLLLVHTYNVYYSGPFASLEGCRPGALLKLFENTTKNHHFIISN